MWWRIIGSVFISLILIAFELGGVAAGNFKINLIAAALIFLVYYGCFWESLVFAGVSGLLVDFFSIERFGFFLGLFLFFALFLNVMTYNFFSAKTWLTFFIFSFSGLFLYNLFFLISRAAVTLNFVNLYAWPILSARICEMFSTLVFVIVINALAGQTLKYFNSRQ